VSGPEISPTSRFLFQEPNSVGFDLRQKGFRGAFPHQIDHANGMYRATQETCRALLDFHMVKGLAMPSY
jgi:hypothetical protein